MRGMPMICDDCYHAIAAVTILTPCNKPMVDLCEQCFDMSETARLHPWVPIEDTFVEVKA